MYRQTAIIVCTALIVGCSSGKGETDRERIISCAKLLNKKEVREKLGEGEEPKDPEVRRCLAFHEELKAITHCHRNDEAVEYFDCVYERLGLEKKKSDDGGSKKKQCGKLFDKMNTCVLEMMGDKAGAESPLGKKEDFIKECKKDKDADKAIRCLDKKDCKDFFACLEGINDRGKRNEDAPADYKPADMPAEHEEPSEE